MPETTTQLNLIFSVAFVVLAVAIGLLAAVLPQRRDRAWFLLAALAAALVLGGQNVSALWAKAALLTCAELAAVALVWRQGSPKARQAARTYLVMVAVGSLLTVGVTLASPLAPNAPLVAAFLAGAFLVGWALKLALAPFYFWLPAVAESTSPLTTALIVGVIDIAAFTELTHVAAVMPWVVSEARPLWFALALLSMFGGALLALGQRDIKRMLAFSTIDDMGYLLLGVLVASEVGLTGALIGALAHGLFKALLFGAVAVAEQGTGRPVTLNERGLASRFPVAGVAFIVGSLGMLGVPPLLGFAGRWRLYLAAANSGGPALMLAMMAATGLALLYYVRAVHRTWLGPAVEEQPNPASSAAVREPQGTRSALADGVLAVLIVLSLVLGLAPGLLAGMGA